LGQDLTPAPFASLLNVTKADRRRISELAGPYWLDHGAMPIEGWLEPLADAVRSVLERRNPWADIRVGVFPSPKGEIRLGVFVGLSLDSAIWLTPDGLT
jgi:hypothetical protein